MPRQWLPKSRSIHPLTQSRCRLHLGSSARSARETSGSPFPHSHFDTVLSLMDSFSASCFCVRFCIFLVAAINLPICIWFILFLCPIVQDAKLHAHARSVEYRISTERGYAFIRMLQWERPMMSGASPLGSIPLHGILCSIIAAFPLICLCKPIARPSKTLSLTEFLLCGRVCRYKRQALAQVAAFDEFYDSSCAISACEPVERFASSLF